MESVENIGVDETALNIKPIQRKLSSFMTSTGIQALELLELARESRVFHMQNIALACQAALLVTLLDKTIDSNHGPTLEQFDEQATLEDDLSSLENTIEAHSSAPPEWEADYDTCEQVLDGYFTRLWTPRSYFDAENVDLVSRIRMLRDRDRIGKLAKTYSSMQFTKHASKPEISRYLSTDYPEMSLNHLASMDVSKGTKEDTSSVSPSRRSSLPFSSANLHAQEIEQSLRHTISDRTPENDAVAFQRVKAFISQCPAEIPQLEAKLENLYHSKTFVAPLDLFVEVLYILRDHLTAESISKNWWYFVLGPALRRAHVTRTTTRHAIELSMVGLKEGETEFRRYLILSFVGGLPSFNSIEGAIDSVAQSDNERSQESRWKDSLMEILTEDAERYPEQFFDEIDRQFVHLQHRLPLVELLSRLAPKETFPIKEFGNHKFTMNFLLSLFIDNSASVFTLELSTLTMLIPNFAVNSPARLKEILPELFAILARAICWQPRGLEHDEPPDIWHRNLEVRADLRWQRLDSSFELAVSSSPDASRYFNSLYGIYPVNCIAFLRGPIAYLIEHGCRTPFVAGWEEVLYYEDEIWSRCDNLLRNHIIHPALIRGTAQEELDSSSHWNMDVASLITASSLLDARNTTSSSHGTFTELQASLNIWSEGGEILGDNDESANPMVEHGLWSGHGRPTISLRQLMETHSLLRSGMPVSVLNDYTEIPSTPRVQSMQSPALDLAIATLGTTFERPLNETRSPETASLTSTQREEAMEEAISVLQRDALLMMNELNFEAYLRRAYLAEIGLLHKQSVQTRSSELERQRMREQIKRNEQEIERHKLDKQKLQNEIDRYRAGGDNFSQNMRHQLHKMKKEKEDWLAEAQELRTRDAEMQDVLQAKSARLQDTEIQILKLENAMRENEAKIKLIKDYERQIEVLRKAEQIWHEDGRRLKWQDDLIKQYKSKLTVMQSIIDSESLNNAQLGDENRYLEQRVGQLEEEIELIRFTTSSLRDSDPSKLMQDRESAFIERVDALERENAKLRSRNHNLEDQLLQEQVERGELEVRLMRHSAMGEEEESLKKLKADDSALI